MFGQLPTLEPIVAIASGEATEKNTSQKNNLQSAPQKSTQAPENFSIEDFQISWEEGKLSHQQQLQDIISGATVKAMQAEAEKVSDAEILEEGVHFHKLLEFLVPQSSKLEKFPAMLSEQEVMNWLSVNQAVAKKLLTHTQVVLNTPELQLYLSSGKWLQAWNELDIASEDGKSFRLDRLVEMDDHLAIIDYKLSIPKQDSEMYDKYLKQLENYQKELKRIRPDKENKAYLISSGGKIEQIGEAL